VALVAVESAHENNELNWIVSCSGGSSGGSIHPLSGIKFTLIGVFFINNDSINLYVDKLNWYPQSIEYFSAILYRIDLSISNDNPHVYNPVTI
jgi:hypothetical protein